MEKHTMEIVTIDASEIKLTGISRHGCAVVTIGDIKPVLISRLTYSRILNDPCYIIKGVIVRDSMPYKGVTYSRLLILKM